MNIFEKLESGEAVDMYTEEYRPAVEELHRSSKALHRLNAAEPLSEEQVAHQAPPHHLPHLRQT